MNKLKLYLIGALLVMPLFSFGQFWEVGLFLGGSNYSGDLSPDLIQIAETHPAVGVIGRANVSKHWTIKGNAYYGRISGSDAKYATKEMNRDRNLSFASDILDIGINAEWNILPFQAGYTRKNKFTPYLFGGLSVFTFDPRATYRNPKTGVEASYRLQPLGTEGQETTYYNDRHKYALTQISIPLGFGLKFNVHPNINIGLEVGARKTFTDYLDDVSKTYVPSGFRFNSNTEIANALGNRSGENNDGVRKIVVNQSTQVQRGNSENMDWYGFAGFTVTYTILSPFCPKF